MEKAVDYNKCIELFKEAGLTPNFINILHHCRKVNAIAMFIATKLKEKGEEIDLDLVDIASFLHDVKKAEEVNLKDWGSHEKRAAEFLKAKGYNELACIILKHRSEESVLNGIKGMSWEDKLVYYADKRVKHDEVVSAKERMRDGFERYSKLFNNHDFINRHDAINEQLTKIENEIFNKLGLKPEDINEESIKPFLIDEKIITECFEEK